MNRLTKILSSRFAGIFCLLFAIANRIVFTTLYSLVGVDTKLQLTYAENFLAGKGMGAIKYFTNDLNNPVFDTQQYFPPGFSLTIIPFLKLFGGDEYKAVLAFDIMVAVLFVIAVRSLGKKVVLPPALNNTVTLIAGCSQYLFFTSWSSTDAIGVCLLLFGLRETISIINKGEDISFWRMTGCGLLFCLPFFFRYMYLPIAVLLPFLILIFGFLLKNKDLKKGGAKICAVTVFLLSLFFVTSFSTAGNALYIMNEERGLFIHQLDLCHPFLPASFIDIDFGAQLIQSAVGIEYSRTIIYLKIINLILFVLFIILLWRYTRMHRKKIPHSTHFLFIILGSFISLTIILLLTYLSITYKELTWGFYRWVHVWEGRYFAFIYVFIPLLLFVCLHHYRSSFINPIIRFFVIIALCCIATETMHGIYYNVKILMHHKDLALIRDADKGFRNFPALIKDIEKQNPDRQLIVCSPDKFYLHTASQLGYKAVFDYDNFLLQPDLKVSSKSILIMPIQTQDVVIIKDYIENKKPRLFYTIAGTSFYIQEIDP